MSVGLKKKGSTILADTSPLCKNNQKSICMSWNKGNPRSSRRAGVIITMKSGGHRRGLLISTKH